MDLDEWQDGVLLTTALLEATNFILYLTVVYSCDCGGADIQASSDCHLLCRQAPAAIDPGTIRVLITLPPPYLLFHVPLSRTGWLSQEGGGGLGWEAPQGWIRLTNKEANLKKGENNNSRDDKLLFVINSAQYPPSVNNNILSLCICTSTENNFHVCFISAK